MKNAAIAMNMANFLRTSMYVRIVKGGKAINIYKIWLEYT